LTISSKKTSHTFLTHEYSTTGLAFLSHPYYLYIYVR
jgi:hypothetical protein